jgi:antitoxin component YwqK of YwqJK toxin-antitoxin module
MKNILPLMTLFICLTKHSSSQNDSSVIYLNKEGKETIKDSAFIYGVFNKNNAAWHGKVYYSKTQTLQSEGDYGEMNFKIPLGVFSNYKDDGTLDNTSIYNKGKITERTYYYKNGNKKSHIIYSDNGITEQKGWDENGKEISDYIVEREAQFKGGVNAWQKYLAKHLNGNVPVDAGAPAGDYTVQVQFVVNKEGYITEAKATSIPPKCKPCAAEAVSVILDGPLWEPAIQNNQPVIYRQIQSITFQVVDQKRKGNKN